MWERLSFRNKILMACLAIIFFLSGFTLIVGHYMSDIHVIGSEVTDDQVPELLWVTYWQKDVYHKQLALERFLEHKSTSILEQQLDGGEQQEPLDGEVPPSLSNFQLELERAKFTFDNKVSGLILYGNTDNALNVIREEILPLLYSVERELEEVYQQTTADLEALSSRMSSIILMLLWVLFLGTGLAIGLAVYFSYRISRRLTRPVNGLVEQVDRIAQGEYGLQVNAPTQVELSRLTDAINHMSQSLHESFELEKRMHRSEKLALLGELAAGSAHEIRNPLAVIHGFMHLLEKELSERHKQRYHIPLLMQELVRINHIVEDMLMLARPGAPDIERGSLHTILEEIIPLIEQNAPPGIRFEWDVHENKLCMDGQQMKQVFHNLLRNSMEALEEEGTIRVYTRLDEQRMHIFVEDNGPGIPEELRESIFDPFISSKKTGTGLGLTIIQRIIENHKGTVCIASTGEQGTTFQLTLRLFRPVAEE